MIVEAAIDGGHPGTPGLRDVNLGSNSTQFSVRVLGFLRPLYRSLSWGEICSRPDPAIHYFFRVSVCANRRRSKWGQTKLPPVWDVEEAVQLGKTSRACPYYTARDSLVTADLVLW